MTRSKILPITILGGGISGLSVGYYLKKRGIPFTLLECSEKCGGVIFSQEFDDTIYEYGPNSIRDKKGIILEMVEDLNLNEDLISVSENFKTRYIAKNGSLIPLTK